MKLHHNTQLFISVKVFQNRLISIINVYSNMNSIFELFKNKKVILFILASVLFGGTFVGAKAGLEYMPPILFVALRYDIAALVLFLYLITTHSLKEIIPRNKNDILAILAAGVFAIGAANGFLFIGQIETTSAVSAIIFSLIPIFTPILAILLLNERLTIEGSIGTVISLVGVSFVIGITPSNIVNSFTLGTLFVLAGAFSTSFGTVLIRWSKSNLESTIRTAWALPISAIMLHIISYSKGESVQFIEWNYISIISLLYVGIFAGAIAYVAYFRLLDDVGAIKSSIVFYISPIIATIGGWILLNEPLSENSITGFIIIFTGFIIMEWSTIYPILLSYFDRKQSHINIFN